MPCTLLSCSIRRSFKHRLVCPTYLFRMVTESRTPLWSCRPQRAICAERGIQVYCPREHSQACKAWIASPERENHSDTSALPNFIKPMLHVQVRSLSNTVLRDRCIARPILRSLPELHEKLFTYSGYQGLWVPNA